MSSKGWIGVDLDGTLAEYNGWKGAGHIGAPIKPMVERVKRWLAEGRDVRIFTARVYAPDYFEPTDENAESYREMMDRRHDAKKAKIAIDRFCLEHFGRELEVTCTKDYGMLEVWDDRAVQVIPNSGIRVDGTEALAA
ncbi:hypothetical protein PQQ87_08835 [Paraburkholderia nemoris]|uniref:hypothetical protein n=1 Tax=Paraburkholderia nemoris TaxID=2793076 RepID=UPI0038B9E2C5